MLPILEVRHARAEQPQVCLVDQRRGLQGAGALLAGHLGGREFAQLVIDELEELVAGLGAAAAGGVDELRQKVGLVEWHGGLHNELRTTRSIVIAVGRVAIHTNSRELEQEEQNNEFPTS